MQINFNYIQAKSRVDGPGERTVLFMQGCSHHCPGCQNTALWEPRRVNLVETDTLALTLAMLNMDAVTISGGEPFQQVKALAHLVLALRGHGVNNILVYTGYTWEEITSGMSGNWLWVQTVLDNIDTLVDGRFIASQDDDLITWRGSRNQRPIDVPATLKAGKIITHNWDNPEIVITPDGSALMPVGLVSLFASIGQVENTRQCGEVQL